MYVRPYHNEDISIWVKKVHFKLHNSYDNPNRVKETPPFEICETGWGEFELVIKIYFQDTDERPVSTYSFNLIIDITFRSRTREQIGFTTF